MTSTGLPNDDKLTKASRLASKLFHLRKQPLRLAVSVARRPGDIAALTGVVKSVPSVRVELRDRRAEAFAQRLQRAQYLLPPLVRQPVFLLEIPSDDKTYLAGRRKQAMRTNLRHAERAGCSCYLVEEEEDLKRAEKLLLQRWQTEGFHYPNQTVLWNDPSHVILLGTDESGTPNVIGGVWVCSPWAIVQMVARLDDQPASSYGRYLVHLELVRHLRERGVTHLVGDPALSARAGLQYVHYLLGFDLAYLTFEQPEGRVRPSVAVGGHRTDLLRPEQSSGNGLPGGDHLALKPFQGAGVTRPRGPAQGHAGQEVEGHLHHQFE
jgi:hypothetical protein